MGPWEGKREEGEVGGPVEGYHEQKEIGERRKGGKEERVTVWSAVS